MRKVQFITITLFYSFAYGQNTGILNVNYANIDKNKLTINQEIPDNYEGNKSCESKKTFYTSGIKKSEIVFNSENSILNSKTLVSWYESGQIKSVINYTNDNYNGSLTTFWENGNPKRQDIYKMGKLVEGKCFDFEGNEINYYNYEILPEFIGGTKALYSYIKKEIHYPEEALENKHTGKVTVSFVVSETGKIREEKIIKGCEECLNIEALRIMQNMPKWNPGQVDGEYVSMQIGIPIFFLIAD